MSTFWGSKIRTKFGTANILKRVRFLNSDIVRFYRQNEMASSNYQKKMVAKYQFWDVPKMVLQFYFLSLFILFFQVCIIIRWVHGFLPNPSTITG